MNLEKSYANAHTQYMKARRAFEKEKRLMQSRNEKLRRLYEVVKAVPPRKLDMETWGDKQSSCGTVCCAAGWAGSNEWFVKRGLELKFEHSPWHDAIVGNIYAGGVKNGFGGLGKFFNVSTQTAEALFDSTYYEDGNYDTLTGAEAKKEVLKRITILLEKGEDALDDYMNTEWEGEAPFYG